MFNVISARKVAITKEINGTGAQYVMTLTCVAYATRRKNTLTIINTSMNLNIQVTAVMDTVIVVGSSFST